ncbi:MAG: hypothetical protein Kow0059_17740 [Candidatus Sumerlaeia bacterium]
MTRRGTAIIFFVLAVAVAALHVAPYWLFRLTLGAEYRGVVPSWTRDERHYTRQIQTAMQGRYQPRNRYIYEEFHAPGPNSMTWAVTNIYGWLGARLGLGLWTWIYLSRALLPVVAFWLLYRLFRAMGWGRLGSLNLALLQMLAPLVILGRVESLSRPAFELAGGRHWFDGWFEQIFMTSLPWARLANPNLSGLPFLGALVFLVKWMRGAKGRRGWTAFVGLLVCLALTFKLYFYFWSALGALLTGMALIAAMRRDWRAAAPLAAVLAAGAAVALWRYGYLLGLSRIADSASRAFAAGRKVIVSPGVCVALAWLAAGGVWGRRWIGPAAGDRWRWSLFAAPLAVVATMNQQLVTARIVQPWHYEIFTSPILLLMFTFGVALTPERARRCVERWLPDRLNRFSTTPGRVAVALAFLLLVIAGLLAAHYRLAFNWAPMMLKPWWAVLPMIGTVALAAFAFVTVAVLASRGQARWAARIVPIAVTAAVLAEGFSSVMITVQAQAPRVLREQRLAGAFEWLRSQPPGVVMTSLTRSELIPLFTPHFVYLSKNASHYAHPSADNLRLRLFDLLAVLGVDDEDFPNISAQWPRRYILWGMRPVDDGADLYTFGSSPPVTRREVLELAGYYSHRRRELLEGAPLAGRADYVLYSIGMKQDYPEFTPAELCVVPAVYQDQYTAVYALRPEIGRK